MGNGVEAMNENKKDDVITIIISNRKERFVVTGPVLLLAIFFAVWGSIGTHINIYDFVGFGIILLVIYGVHRIEYKLVPWDRPNVYKITNNEIWVSEYYKEGNAFTKYKFSNIKKVVLKNRRIKWIRLWFREYDEYPLDILTAPFFEKCNDDWQRLFEEIRKRIPPDAEVIAK